MTSAAAEPASAGFAVIANTIPTASPVFIQDAKAAGCLTISRLHLGRGRPVTGRHQRAPEREAAGTYEARAAREQQTDTDEARVDPAGAPAPCVVHQIRTGGEEDEQGDRKHLAEPAEELRPRPQSRRRFG